MIEPLSRTAEIRRLARHDTVAAQALLADMLRDLFRIQPRDIVINHDRYSLNSLNGFFSTDDGQFFFKFHQEEGEEAMKGEYYRADILARAELPVDMPVLFSATPGEQILVYPRRNDPRFSDVLRALDLQRNPPQEAQALAAERDLADAVLGVYLGTLHPIAPEQSAAEPIHRLFHERLIDPRDGRFPGGRLLDFYMGKTFLFPGAEVQWNTLSGLRLVCNGIRYRRTLGELFAEAFHRLDARRLADAGGVTAHGDAHNANVWYGAGHRGGARLSFFDPAFTGEHVPALLAEIKPTFHNIFAHPLWLYDPEDAAAAYDARAELRDGDLVVTTDFALSPIRKALLQVKIDHSWKPLLAELARRNMLPADWRRVVRLGLFLCPTLVMNLRAGAGSHNPASSLIALSMAVRAGSEPENGADEFSDFLDAIDPGQASSPAP